MDSQIIALTLTVVGLFAIFGLWGTLDVLLGNKPSTPSEDEQEVQ